MNFLMQYQLNNLKKIKNSLFEKNYIFDKNYKIKEIFKKASKNKI